jgi:cobalt transporter subunit CbtB
MNSGSRSTPIVGIRTRPETRTAAAAAFLLGTTLVFVTGFAHPMAIHNAAHDTRHTLAFPCH